MFLSKQEIKTMQDLYKLNLRLKKKNLLREFNSELHETFGHSDYTALCVFGLFCSDQNNQKMSTSWVTFVSYKPCKQGFYLLVRRINLYSVIWLVCPYVKSDVIDWTWGNINTYMRYMKFMTLTTDSKSYK